MHCVESEDEKKPKKIFDPCNKEELLLGWLLHAHKGRDRHDEAARQLNGKHYTLGVPACVLSAVVGASIISSLEADIGWTIIVLIGLLSIAASALAGLQTFFNYSERAEAHRAIGVRYKAIIREIEEMLAREIKTDDSNTLNELEGLRAKLDVLELDAPVMPQKIFDEIERKYKYSNVKFINRADDLYNELSSGLNANDR